MRMCARKTGDRLVLDFTGTSKQAPGPINCARSGLVAGILEVLVPAFCVDVPWAHGAVADCVEIISEPGTINNALHPAPTTMATVNGCQATSDLVWQALSRMSGWVPERADETIALGYGGVNGGIINGRFAADDRAFVQAVDGLGGGAARWGSDGVNSGGNIIAPIFAIPNIERLESLGSVLYLWRRERPDSAGAGQWRGGLGVEFAIISHRAAGPLTCVAFNTSWAAPAARGAYGGMPGCLQSNLLIDGFSLGDSDFYDYTGARALPGKALFTLDEGQLWIMTGAGGGGFGDPRLRDPALVDQDVRDGKLSAELARKIYGDPLPPGGDHHGDLPGLYYDYRYDGDYVCHHCGTAFTLSTADHRQWTLAEATPVNAWAGDHGFSLDLTRCPGCGRQYAVDVLHDGGSGALETLRKDVP
jgi:N-methylhydantoinase B